MFRWLDGWMLMIQDDSGGYTVEGADLRGANQANQANHLAA